MHIKVFRAKDMKTALEQVKETFGSDALILSTRTVRKAPFGFLRSPELEVTAALDPGAGSDGGKEGGSGEPPAAESGGSFLEELQARAESQDKATLSSRPSPTKRLSGSSPSATSSRSPGRDISEFEHLRREIAKIGKMVTSQQQMTLAAMQNLPATAAQTPADPGIRFLQGQGVDPSTCRAILDSADQLPGNNGDDLDPVESCRMRLAEWIDVWDWMAEAQQWPKRIAFVGPTGVGKTTTIAKLAARYLQRFGRSLLLVTMDNYRIAAAEQLRIYARIMNVPLEVATTPEHMQAVLNTHGDKKLTLVDTAGRSPRDDAGLQELQDLLGDGQDFDKHLVLSATTREEDLQAIVDRFTPLDISGLIFTKIDETGSLGSLVNVQHRTNCPLTYLTNGQRVPEDLVPADPIELAHLITTPQKDAESDD